MSVALMTTRASRPTGPARPVSQIVPAGCEISVRPYSASTRGKPPGDDGGSGEAADAGPRSGPVQTRPRRSPIATTCPFSSTTTREASRATSSTAWDTYTIGMREFVAERFDQRQDLELALGVERGERLVHQQDLRRGKQRPADRHPLPFAARQPRRLALEQMLDAERLDHAVEGDLPRGLRREPAAEQEISPAR